MADQHVPWTETRGEQSESEIQAFCPVPPSPPEKNPPPPLEFSFETLREELRFFAQEGALRRELDDVKAMIVSAMHDELKQMRSHLKDMCYTSSQPLHPENYETLESEALGVESEDKTTRIAPSAIYAGVSAESINFNMKGYFAMTELKESAKEHELPNALQAPADEQRNKTHSKTGMTPTATEDHSKKMFPANADPEAPPGSIPDEWQPNPVTEFQDVTMSSVVPIEQDSGLLKPSPRATQAHRPTHLHRKKDESAVSTPASTSGSALNGDSNPSAYHVDIHTGITGIHRLSQRNQGCWQRSRLRAQRLTHNPMFDYASGLLILANAIQIGIQTDYAARHRGEVELPSFRVLEVCFCWIFTAELGLRLLAESKQFFIMKGWRWNVFDIVVVGLQLLEEFLALATKVLNQSEEDVIFMNLSFLRVLRVMRLVRIIRLVRLLRLISELRTLIMSILCSMKSLLWTMVLLFIMIYIFSVYFTQVIADYDGKHHDDLAKYYASLDLTILTLYQSITGGIDWRDAVDPLIKRISPWMAVSFSCYIAFSVLAVMNVVTGVFVESALLSAKGEQDIFMVNNLRDLFQLVTVDKGDDCHPTDLVMRWEDFEEIVRLESVQMKDYFKAIDVDLSDARGIFCLLDQDNTGFVTFNDFVNGCCRLRGQAKALDIQILLHELRRFSAKMEAHAHYVEGGLHFKKLARYLPKAVAAHGYRIERLSDISVDNRRRSADVEKTLSRDSLTSGLSLGS